MVLLPNEDRPSSFRAGALGLLLVCAGVTFAVAASADPAARDRALRLAAEGRCASALPELDTARLTAVDDVELALRAGECRLRLRRYAEALRDLTGAAELAPQRGDVQHALVKAAYHAGEFDVARSALERAEALRPDDAELALYRGMLHIESGDDAAAIEALERARSLDADRVEPVAGYQIGLARARLRDSAGATAELESIAGAWEGTDWATRAEQEIARIRKGAARHAWLNVGAGFEHDTNVILRGRGVPEPSNISDDADQRGVWTANGGAELYKTSRTTLGAMASYRGTTHTDLHSFDAHFPSATLWLDHALDEETLASARYDYGYAWLDGDPFLGTNGWQLSLQRGFGEWGRSAVHARTHLDEYFFRPDQVPDATGPNTCPSLVTPCGPIGLDERSERRRSGWGYAAGYQHSLPVATSSTLVPDLTLRAGYEFSAYDARGREYTHDAHTVRVGFGALLPFELGLDVSGAYSVRQFRHPTTFPDPPVDAGVPYPLSAERRFEEVYQVETVLQRALSDSVSVSARWRWLDNQSNAKVFDYEHHVLGFYVNLAFGREL